jgi:hypothetical protein
MQQRFDDSGPSPDRRERRGGFNFHSAALTFAFATFVLGGFSFGWLFLNNWKMLATFQAAQVRIPGGGGIWIPPVAPAPTPVARGGEGRVEIPPVPVPALTPEAETRPEDAYKDLPDWTKTK